MKYTNDLNSMLNSRPTAEACISGSNKYPDIKGKVRFHQLCEGVLVHAEICGLPKKDCSIFAFHIHSGTECGGNKDDPFVNADGHYNPDDCPHPCHAGDMPPLFGANGKAVLAFLSDRFKVSEILGRTVIIHAKPDDFTTQPSGNAGEKIACGTVKCLCKQLYSKRQ